MDNFSKLLRFDRFEFFAPGFQLFERFDDGFGHASVGFVGSADDGKLFGGSQALVAILVIEADTKEMSGLRFAATGYFLHWMPPTCSRPAAFQVRFARRHRKEYRRKPRPAGSATFPIAS